MQHSQVLKNYINGALVKAQTQDYFDLVNPATEEVIAQSPNSSQADIDQAYLAAHEAFKTWGRTTPSVRQKALLDLADAIEKQKFRNKRSLYT